MMSEDIDKVDPNKLVEVRRVTNEFEAGIIVALLQDAGIQSRAVDFDGASRGIFGAASFYPRSVLVRRQDAERADELLTKRREESVDLDWDEVDVGDPADGLARRIGAGDHRFPRMPRRLKRIIVVLGIAFLLLLLVANLPSIFRGDGILGF